jgi:chemotaxis protein MotB
MSDMPPGPPSTGRETGDTKPGPAVFGGYDGRRGSANAWMVTFTDLVALMLTFFVMIFAMSTVKVSDWQSLSDSLRRHLDSVAGQQVAAPSLRLDMPAPERTAGADLDYLAGLLRGQLRSTPALEQARVRLEGDRLYLSLPADLLFDSGRYALTQSAADAVFAIGGVLRNLSNAIEVVGHADPRPPKRRYASNWELSLLRAHAVADALLDAGVPAPLRARGHGDALFAQLSDRLPPERRRALARRVDLVIQATARDPEAE